jgi:hypothetical protein
LVRAILDYLTATRGLGSPEARICYERAEPLCHSLNDPRLLYLVLIGRWRYSLMNDKLTATMQIAERVYSLAQEQDDPTLMIAAYNGLAATLYYLGDFELGQQYAMGGVEIWRSGNVRPYAIEDFHTPVVACLYHGAMSEWHLGQIASCQAHMDEAISKHKRRTWSFWDPPLLSVACVRALLEVRAVTDPPRSATGNHRNWAIVPADLCERQITPGVGHGRNVLTVVGNGIEFRGEQFFVTEVSTRFEGHGSSGDSVEATADQGLSDRQLVPVVSEQCSLRGKALGNRCDRIARQCVSSQQGRIHGIRNRRDRPQENRDLRPLTAGHLSCGGTTHQRPIEILLFAYLHIRTSIFRGGHFDSDD